MMERIIYKNDNWTGEIFDKYGNIIMRDTDIIYFTLKNRKIDTYEKLAKQVDTFKYLDEHREEIHQKYLEMCSKENSN